MPLLIQNLVHLACWPIAIPLLFYIGFSCSVWIIIGSVVLYWVSAFIVSKEEVDHHDTRMGIGLLSIMLYFLGFVPLVGAITKLIIAIISNL